MQCDAAKRVIQTTFTLRGIAGITDYTYDAQGRLNQAIRRYNGTTTTTTYSYASDAWGNTLISSATV
jgi:hypothetical protein